MIRVFFLAAALYLTATSAWAHPGHGPVFVGGHSHLADVAAVVAVVIAIAVIAWSVFRSRRTK